MKIHKLKFENINSLKGKWEIDFDNPDLTRENIFLITGKTGSGKSSIFDAITLALYGETTRQGKITGTANELMNKHSGECSSEVTFSTNGTKYIATFTQHRSRKSPEGNLQGKKQSLINLKTNENLVSKTCKCEEAVEKLVGLNFNQFSKTVMLAQGSFDKFLKAEKDEKASILEQITGTQIYTEISKKVYEHTKEEKQKLNTLNQVLGSIELLSDEEIKSKNDEKEQINIEIKKIDKDISEVEKILSYYSKLKELNKKEVSLSSLNSEIEERRDSYNLNKIKIEKYNKALPIIQLNKEKKAYDVQKDTSEQTLKTLCLSKSEKKAKQIELTTKIDKLKENLEDEENNLNSLISLIKQVRELDTKIEKEKSNYNISKIKFENKEKELNSLKDEIEKDKETILLKKTALSNANKFIEQNKQLLKYEQTQDEVLSNFYTYIQIEKSISNLKDSLKKEQEKTTSILTKFAEKTELVKSIEDKILHHKKQKKNLNFDEEQLSNLLKEIGENKQILKTCLINYATYYKNKANIENFEKNLHQKLTAQQQNNIKIKYTKELIENQKEIIGLKRYTHLLKEGEKCPLCGSTTHPSILEADNSKIEKLQDELSQLTQQEEHLKKDISSIESSVTMLKIQQGEIEKTLTNEIIIYIYSKETYEEKISVEIDNLSKEENKLNAIKTRLSELETSILNDTNLLVSEKANLTIATSDKQTNENYILEYKQEIKEKEKQLKDLSSTLDEFIISKTYKELSDLFNTFNTNCKSSKELTKELKTLTEDVAKYEIKIKALSIERDRLNIEKDEIESKLIALKSSRKELFEDKDCDKELEKENSKIKLLQNTLDFTQVQLNPINNDLIKLEENIKSENKNIEKLTSSSLEIENSILKQLTQLQIESIEKALSFDLDKSSVEMLVEDIKNFENMEIEYNTLAKDIAKSKNDLQLQKVDLDKETAEEKQNILKITRDDKIAQKSRINTILETNAENKEKFKEREQEIKKQKHISEKWDILDKAIGSSDGKKFKTIAQGITLDYLIHNTNQKLIELFPRYELYRIKDDKNSLELGVVDKYSAAIKRPVTNLSGGETFVISFSLALGLSDLLNSRVKIETLFIDEGFGTLDEETLTQSLEAIENLTRSGKVIGLISHVSILHDRIRSQIKVEENGDSTSSLSGPGVK